MQMHREETLMFLIRGTLDGERSQTQQRRRQLVPGAASFKRRRFQVRAAPGSVASSVSSTSSVQESQSVRPK
jgi:hypothetical protein